MPVASATCDEAIYVHWLLVGAKSSECQHVCGKCLRHIRALVACRCKANSMSTCLG